MWREGLIGRGSSGGTRPDAHAGRKAKLRIKPRNSAASGRLAANASLTRLLVSLIRTAIFSKRSRVVENSLLTNFCVPGMASCTVRISQ